MKAVAQEHQMGCSVACVASLTRKSYSQALKLFPSRVQSQGSYCKDICNALKKANLRYAWRKVTKQSKDFLREGAIVYIAKSKKYPAGHFLLRTNRGWMNPWINYPSINPAKAGFQKSLPGVAQWIIFPEVKPH